MKLPERHQSFIDGKMRPFYLLPIVYYPNSGRLALRWPIRNVGRIRWTYYFLNNMKTALMLPYLIIHNLHYFGKTGIKYQEIDYDAVYG